MAKKQTRKASSKKKALNDIKQPGKKFQDRTGIPDKPVVTDSPEEIKVLTPPGTVFDDEVPGGLRPAEGEAFDLGVGSSSEPPSALEIVKCRYCGREMPKPLDGSTFYHCEREDCPGTGTHPSVIS